MVTFLLNFLNQLTVIQHQCVCSLFLCNIIAQFLHYSYTNLLAPLLIVKNVWNFMTKLGKLTMLSQPIDWLYAIM